MSDEREEIAGDGKERVKGQQKDGPPPARELWRVLLVGVPVLIAVWYLMRLLGLR